MKQFKRALLMPWAGGANPLAYTNKVIAIAPANLIAYWPLADTSGSTAVNAEGTAARNGTYPGGGNTPTLGAAGIGDGRTSASFDGGDYVSIHTASLAAAFNGVEGTLSAWFQVSAVGDWSDSTERNVVKLTVDASNFVHMKKANTGFPRFTFQYVAGGTSKVLPFDSPGSPTTFVHVAVTWSDAADQVKFYYAGVQVGSTLTGLGTFAGSLGSAGTLIGANTTIANFWKGQLAHVAVWTTPLSAAQILSIATVL